MWVPGVTRIVRRAAASASDPRQQSASGWPESAEHLFLHSIGERANQQIAADAARRFGEVEGPPTFFELGYRRLFKFIDLHVQESK